MKIAILNISWDTMRLQLKKKRKESSMHMKMVKISVKETHQDIKNTQSTNNIFYCIVTMISEYLCGTCPSRIGENSNHYYEYLTSPLKGHS